MQRLRDSQIGGGVVTRPFHFHGEKLPVGRNLTAEQIRSIPIANRQSLINQGHIDLYPISAPAANGETERFLIIAGPGKFHVVEGRRLTAEPIGKEEATALRDGTRA